MALAVDTAFAATALTHWRPRTSVAPAALPLAARPHQARRLPAAAATTAAAAAASSGGSVRAEGSYGARGTFAALLGYAAAVEAAAKAALGWQSPARVPGAAGDGSGEGSGRRSRGWEAGALQEVGPLGRRLRAAWPRLRGVVSPHAAGPPAGAVEAAGRRLVLRMVVADHLGLLCHRPLPVRGDRRHRGMAEGFAVVSGHPCVGLLRLLRLHHDEVLVVRDGCAAVLQQHQKVQAVSDP
eukprot:CAMPEP_0183531094 /NCGR_PEP_ID=MMETSP0371-20130417/24582_1 /TAXON_ID=268820 /ORGANISM="Peridinium aciculiferum, Strain PAER-2" /LENGTH=239 /DNA_ID=CAMNT_0025731065 /DNA_START=24 /DNA_END=742 /DNA_ORIENTATION=+